MLREALTLDRLRAIGPEAAAALLLARRDEGLVAGEEALLARWLDDDPRHRAAFAHASEAWDRFADAEGDELLDAMRAHALAPPLHAAPWRRWTAAAAALLVVLAAGALLLDRSSLAPGPGEAPVSYASGAAVRALTLADGSRVTLDAQSALSAQLGARERRIVLTSGRALFSVRPDAARPFAVLAGGRRVVATGTRFEVDLAPAGLRVSLIEGAVTVAPADGSAAPVTLRPGQVYRLAGGGATIAPIPAGRTPGIWAEGMIEFDDDPLAEASRVMNRYGPERLVIRDPRIAAMRISGRFRAGEIERFAATVTEIHRLRSVRRGNQIELTGAD